MTLEGDAVQAAIQAVGQGQGQPSREWPVTIGSTGRQALLVLPLDASDTELLELAGWMLTFVRATYEAERQKGAASRIVLPR